MSKIMTPKLKGKSPEAETDVDDIVRKLDGTENESLLGATPLKMTIFELGAPRL
jgi:enolase